MAVKKVKRIPGRHGIKQPPRSRAFFLELLLNMLIFALCAVMILQVFVQGKTVTDKSEALTVLTMQAESVAETYKVSNGDLLRLAYATLDEEYIGVLNEEGALVYYYDGNLEPSFAEDARYSLVLTPVASANTPIDTLAIAGFEGEELLFSFDVSRYQPSTGGR